MADLGTVTLCKWPSKYFHLLKFSKHDFTLLNVNIQCFTLNFIRKYKFCYRIFIIDIVTTSNTFHNPLIKAISNVQALKCSQDTGFFHTVPTSVVYLSSREGRRKIKIRTRLHRPPDPKAHFVLWRLKVIFIKKFLVSKIITFLN